MTSHHVLRIKAVLPGGEVVELGWESIEAMALTWWTLTIQNDFPLFCTCPVMISRIRLAGVG